MGIEKVIGRKEVVVMVEGQVQNEKRGGGGRRGGFESRLPVCPQPLTRRLLNQNR